MSEATAYHFRRLAAAIVARAVRDAKSANDSRAIEARSWLVAEAGDLLDALDIPQERLADWVAGLPVVAQLSFEL